AHRVARAHRVAQAHHVARAPAHRCRPRAPGCLVLPVADLPQVRDAMGMSDVSTPGGDPDRDPDGPTDLRGPTWKYTLKRAAAEFTRDQLQDRAAALTYYSVLSMFPALIVLVSLLGLIGQGQETTDETLGVMDQYLTEDGADQ